MKIIMGGKLIRLGVAVLLSFLPTGSAFAAQAASTAGAPAPQTADQWTAAGNAAFQAKNYAGAAKAWQAALDLKPTNPATLFSLYQALGVVQNNLGQLQASADAYTAALAVKSMNAKDASAAVKAALAQGNQNKARTVIQALASFTDAESESGGVICPTAIGNFEKALQLEQSLTDPQVANGFIGIYYGEAACYYEMKRYSAGRDALNGHIDLTREDAGVYTLLGNLQFAMQNYAAAMQAYQQALASPPQVAGPDVRFAAYYGLGSAYMIQHQPAPAISAYNSALELKPNNPDVLMGLGGSYIEAGRRDDALKMYNALLPLDSQRAQVMLEDINKLPTAPGNPAPSANTSR